MKYFLTTITVTLSFLMHINGNTETSTCGVRVPYRRRLMTYSYPTYRWPWHVVIYHQNGETRSYQCGGSVIGSNSILTAAHCVSIAGVKMRTTRVSVGLGRDEAESNNSFYEVTEIIIHPNFTDFDLNNDIAIVKLLDDAANFSGKVRTVCLWKSSKKDISNVIRKVGTVIGWGRTETGQISNELRQASMPVVSWGACIESNRPFAGSFLTERNFCAGLRNGTSVCNGDSGGSMTFEENGIYYIRGIVSTSSFNINHTTQELVCSSMEYAIFTDVAQYLDWIRETVTIECEEMVQCEFVTYGGIYYCSIIHNVEPSSQGCKIIFNEAPNTAVEWLGISGVSDVIPVLSDALDKFVSLKTLSLEGIKLKTVKRTRLASFRQITSLLLSHNEITQLDVGTFQDLTNLAILNLEHNKLKELHVDLFGKLHNLETLWLDYNEVKTLPSTIFNNNKKMYRIFLRNNQLTELDADLFKELRNLEYLYLGSNKLEVLPRGLFRNNEKLRFICLLSNQIKKIEADFHNLPNLAAIEFTGNVCINYYCTDYCNTSSSIEMNEKIQRNCTN